MKQMLLAASTLLALGAMAVPASADMVPGIAGRAANPADASCFPESYGSVSNTCGSSKGYVIPIHIINSGSRTSGVRAMGASTSNNVGCSAWTADASWTTYGSTSTQWLSTFGSASFLSLGSLSVAAGGTMWVYCSVDPGGRIIGVNFTP